MRLPLAILSALLLLGGCGDHRSGGGASPPGPGQAAAALVQSSSYAKLRVQVDYVPGYEPSQQALDFLARRLREQCAKPGGVEVVLGSTLGGQRPARWSEADLRAYADAHPLARPRDPGTFQLRVLYLDGQSALDVHGEPNLGSAFTPTTLALFKATLDANPPQLTVPAALEGAILVHEAGHLMGLVGLGAPLTGPHGVPTRPGHCNQASCVMNAHSAHWGGGLGVYSLLSGATTIDFCRDCKGDLAALRASSRSAPAAGAPRGPRAP